MLVQDSKTLILMALLVSSNAPLPFLNRLQQIKREKSLVYQTYCRPDSTRILCNNIRLFCVPAFGKILTFLIPKSLEKRALMENLLFSQRILISLGSDQFIVLLGFLPPKSASRKFFLLLPYFSKPQLCYQTIGIDFQCNGSTFCQGICISFTTQL